MACRVGVEADVDDKADARCKRTISPLLAASPLRLGAPYLNFSRHSPDGRLIVIDRAQRLRPQRDFDKAEFLRCRRRL